MGADVAAAKSTLAPLEANAARGTFG
jgi:hypothetical protein